MMRQNMADDITLLVAEDDRFNRMLIVAMLAKHKNIKVFEAQNGLEALDLLRIEKIDMLLLDLHMPKMDGFETIQVIRQTEKIKDIPIMVISSDEIERRQSLHLGANQFISKPINMQSLEEHINSALGEK